MKLSEKIKRQLAEFEGEESDMAIEGEDATEDAPAMQAKVLAKIESKPVQAKVKLYAALVDQLNSLIGGYPQAKMPMKKLYVEFLKNIKDIA